MVNVCNVVLYSVAELLQKMFTRLEEDYNGKETNTRLVQQVSGALSIFVSMSALFKQFFIFIIGNIIRNNILSVQGIT